MRRGAECTQTQHQGELLYAPQRTTASNRTKLTNSGVGEGATKNLFIDASSTLPKRYFNLGHYRYISCTQKGGRDTMHTKLVIIVI